MGEQQIEVALNEVDRLKAENKELKKIVGENGSKTELELQLSEASKARREAEFGILKEENKSLKKKEIEIQQLLKIEKEKNEYYLKQVEELKSGNQELKETNSQQKKTKRILTPKSQYSNARNA